MTVTQKNYIKDNILTFANILVLVGFIINQSQWQKSVDSEIELNKQHRFDSEMHMPFKEKVQVFVPRIEIDSRLKNIENTLIEIKDNLKKK